MPVSTLERKVHPGTRMDHDLYSYSAYPARPKLTWPNGARVALWIVPALEFIDLVPPEGAWRPPSFPSGIDVRGWSIRDYGNRYGIFRVMEALDRYGFTASAALNAKVCELYPAVVEEILQRNWEVMAHGELNTRVITSQMPEDEERALIARSRDAITKAAGKAPAGWLSPQVGESTRTPLLVADAGFSYIADWSNDDQPYDMHVPSGRFLSLPYSAEVNDVQVIQTNQQTAWQWEQIGRDNFDALYEEGAENGMVVCLALHPFCIGQPLRIKYLENLLGYIAGHGGVWNATGEEIARHYLANTAP